MPPEEKENPKIEIAAGDSIIDICPICHVKYAEKYPTNIKLTCPDCGSTFMLRVYD